MQLVPRLPQAFNRGLGLVDFVPSSLRQVDTIVTSCPIWLLLGEFTALYQAELEGSTSPSQYTALQLNNGTLQTVGSRLLERKLPGSPVHADGRNTHVFSTGKRLSWLTDT